MAAQQASPPSLMSKEAVTAVASTRGSGDMMISEVLTKVNNAKDKTKKIQVLKQYNSQPMRQILKGAMDPRIEWEIPTGKPPFIPNDAPAGTEHTTLMQEARKLYHFIKGADPATSKPKKESIFIEMLESLHVDEANVLIWTKDKELHKHYKGLSPAVVKEAFDWNDDFTKKA